MKIASLDPYLTELLIALGGAGALCGVSSSESFKDIGCELPVLTRPRAQGAKFGASPLDSISGEALHLSKLKECSPDLVVTSIPYSEILGNDYDFQALEDRAGLELSELLGHGVRVRIFNPQTLEDIFKSIERLGIETGYAAKGRDLSSRTRAQLMDWSDNFYDRTHNKKVTFLSSIEPFNLGSLWIPDLIRFASAVPQEGRRGGEVSLSEISSFRPDVIVIAPRGNTLEDAARLFKYFETLPGFGELPAVKRGEVFFADGVEHFYQPNLRIIESMAILISAIAGMDSGYITKRDSFYRLRWLELQRHRFT